MQTCRDIEVGEIHECGWRRARCEVGARHGVLFEKGRAHWHAFFLEHTFIHKSLFTQVAGRTCSENGAWRRGRRKQKRGRHTRWQQ